jgi:hypothetical protein
VIRSIRLTDFTALVSFSSKAFLNQARSHDGFGVRKGKASSLAAFLDQWLSLDENRQTWICLQGGRIQGLVSTRSRAGPTVWEIDQLLLSENNEAKEICFDLLSYLSVVGGEVRVEKVFLRLSAASHLLGVARQAGFSHYLSEILYRWDGQPTIGQHVPLPHPLRLKSKRDEMGLFQLYNAAVPDCVRSVEAVTLREWRESRERGWHGWRSKEFVLEKENNIVGWLGVFAKGRIGHFDILTYPQEEGTLGALVEVALSCLRGKSTIYCLVPEFAGRLRQILEEHGLKEEEEYSALVKQLAARVRQPHFVLARV